MSNDQESDDGEHASATEDCETPPTNQDAGAKLAVNGEGPQVSPVIADDPFAALEVDELNPPLFDAPDITHGVNNLGNDHELLGFGEFAPVMTLAAPTISDADVDFGDFGEAPSTVEAVIHAVPTTEADDSFGDFDEAQSPAEVTAPEPSPPANDHANVGILDEVESPLDNFPDDDDFGDFGDFNEAVETTEVTPPLETGQNSDGFEAQCPAEVAAPEPSIAADDRPNVGILDEAASPSVPDDDDFDDFGDFNEAVETDAVTQPLETDRSGDQFGDFGESSESTPLASQSVLEFKDPFVDRARVVFEQIFGPRSEVDEMEVGSSEEDPQESVRLVDILIRAESSESMTVAPDWAIEKLSSKCGILKVIESSPPSVVLDQFASHPYSHFSRPAQAPILNRSGERKEKRWSSFDLGEKYSFQNSIENGAVSGSADETETVEGNGGPTAATTVPSLPTGVKLDFTNFEAPSENDDSGNGAGIKNVSTTAQLFLQQVPDLSFMLSSKLDLLKK